LTITPIPRDYSEPDLAADPDYTQCHSTHLLSHAFLDIILLPPNSEQRKQSRD